MGQGVWAACRTVVQTPAVTQATIMTTLRATKTNRFTWCDAALGRQARFGAFCATAEEAMEGAPEGAFLWENRQPEEDLPDG